MPSRGKRDLEWRAKVCSLYMRPWVLTRTTSNPRVPLLTNLNLNHFSEINDTPPIRRLRCRTKQSIGAVDWRVRSYAAAWRRYIQGNVVSDHQAKLIQNFLLVMAGTGKHEQDDDDDTGARGRQRREDLGDTSRRLSVEELKAVLKPEVKLKSFLPKNDDGGKENEERRKINQVGEKIDNAMATVERLLEEDLRKGHDSAPRVLARQFHRPWQRNSRARRVRV
jgi:hypothetical protein